MTYDEARAKLREMPETFETPEQIQEYVEVIRTIAEDDEAAHSAEDNLREAVLTSIANGVCEDPSACAFVALTTNQINFYRWCA